MYEEADAAVTEADVGKFIPQKEIEKWWKQQQKKFPNIFTAEEVCPQQHKAGTKLMSYIDDDPNRPMRVEVLGSRWRKDPFMGKQPMYIMRDTGGEFQMTEVTSAHEEEIGWQVGWDLPPPQPDQQGE